jgi:cytochrome c oxidase subunit IV
MSDHSHTQPHAEHEPHAAPLWILGAIFAALLVLTAVTVLTGKFVDLGPYNLLLAMVIAIVKGALVALFFMHLWWDSLFNSIALVAGLAFLGLFIGFSIMDTHQYEPQVFPAAQVLTPEKVFKPHAQEHTTPGAGRAVDTHMSEETSPETSIPTDKHD